ncbi:hypothetical protein [Pseudoduganella danionis]|uniref:hypothetical protein n=1 Tax=Pseudoduganella danionis TaxID=1890295 RepID=UPI0035B124DF
MSTSKLTYTEFSDTSYLSNVAAAARQLLAALLAVKPRSAAVETVVEQPVSNAWLHSLAQDCERHSPNLSAELRFMASRG